MRGDICHSTWEVRKIGKRLMGESKLILGDYEKCREPVLSILIPTLREGSYLYKAIDSALNQKPTLRYEVVVVSNDPSNPLKGVIDRYKNRDNLFLYQNSENIGMVGNSNRCAELARGRYIAYLHDDDYLLSNYLEVISQYILDQDEIRCLITGRYVEYEGATKKSEKIKKYLRKIYFVPSLYRKKLQKITLKDCLKSGTNIYYSPSCGTVVLKDAFDKVGGFDNGIPYSFDLDFFLRFNAVYDIYETTQICAVYRMGANASLKSSVKYEFFDYFSSRYFDFMAENDVDNKYLMRHRKVFLYTVYRQLGADLDGELAVRGTGIEKVGTLRFVLYRLLTALYFYHHNLDIQRLR